MKDMMRIQPALCRIAIAAATLTASALFAQEAATPSATPLTDAIASAPRDVQVFNDHLIILASPWMEGRLPGTRGMELAREYVEAQFKAIGLVPANIDTSSDSASYRQEFELGGTTEFVDQTLSIEGDEFEQGSDFEMTGLGDDAGLAAPISFVGYSIEDGPDGYSSYEEDDDLSGRIAMMFRFEPMNDQGTSLWSDQGWSNHAGFNSKFGALQKRNPAAVILVNTPGADDPRANALMSRGQRMMRSTPVFMVTPETAEKMMQAGGDKRSLMDWRTLADAGDGGVVHLDGPMISMEGKRERVPLMGENIIAMVPGRGDLKDEYVIIGAHMDHLGMGDFGSRSNERALHPGADDNASGTAAVIMLGESLLAAYGDAPDDANLRSILLMAFDGEESGLNGSRFYANNPFFPIEDHALMINFDMIGRIDETNRLAVSGMGSGEGMSEWATPFFDESSLTIVANDGSGGGSDHASFMQVKVPVLFGITPFPLHNDYHTPRDTADKINREGAVATIHLFHELAFDAASRPERFAYAGRSSGGQRGTTTAPPRVRLGIRSTTDEGKPGLRIVSVRAGLSAEKAGIQADDRILKWNDTELESRRELIELLNKQEPGDVVELLVLRDGKELDVSITLQGRDEG